MNKVCYWYSQFYINIAKSSFETSSRGVQENTPLIGYVLLPIFWTNFLSNDSNNLHNLHKLRNNAFDCYFYAFTEKQFYKQPTLHDIENLEPTIYVFT